MLLGILLFVGFFFLNLELAGQFTNQEISQKSRWRACAETAEDLASLGHRPARLAGAESHWPLQVGEHCLQVTQLPGPHLAP